MPDTRPPLDAYHGTFAVPATITVPGGVPVAASVVRMPQRRREVQLGDGSIRFVEPSDVFAIRLDEVATVPNGTVIVAEGKTWRVESLDDVDDEIARVVVVRT